MENRENTSPRIQVEENISSASSQETNQSSKTQESHLVPTEDIVTEEYTVTYEDKTCMVKSLHLKIIKIKITSSGHLTWL